MPLLPPEVLSALTAFVRDSARAPNETVKVQLFLGLVAELFPKSGVVAALAKGAEKTVRVQIEGEERLRRTDTYYGNALIEFERSLDSSLAQAELQLKEQAAGVWTEEGEPDRPLLCVASDGLTWRVYRPRFLGGEGEAPDPAHVELTLLREIRVRPATGTAYPDPLHNGLH